MVVGAGAYFYYALNAMEVIRLSARVMNDPVYMAVGLIGILALAELCRRCVGLPILCVAGALLVYTFSTGLTPVHVIRTLFYTTNGIFSAPIQVCVKFIAVFIIFGAFLERSGVADFFIKFANCAVGRFSGGPATVAGHRQRPGGHGLRFLRGQHRGLRLHHHPHDEAHGLQRGIRRRGGSRPPPPAGRSCPPSWAPPPS